MAPRRPPDILRKSHAHTEGKQRARSKRALLDELAESELTEAPRRALLIKLDGVLYDDTRAIAGAVAALAWIRANSIPHLLVAQTPSETRGAVVNRLLRLGFKVEADEILVTDSAAPAFYDAAIAQLGVDATRLWMISDDLHSDLEAAHEAGIKSILVKTGKYRASGLDFCLDPALVLDSIADLPSQWETGDLHPARESG